MVNYINPIRPDARDDETKRSDRSKPNKPPQGDSFRKSMDEGRSRKDDGENVSPIEEGDEKPPSLFDLPKSNKAKGKPPSKSQGDIRPNNESSPLFPSLDPNKELSSDQGENFSSDTFGFNPFESEGPIKEHSQELPNLIPSQPLNLETTIPIETHPFSQPESEAFSASSPQIEISVKGQQEQKKQLAGPIDTLADSHRAAVAQKTQKEKEIKGGEELMEQNESVGSSKKSKKRETTGSIGSAELKNDPTLTVNGTVQSVSLQTEKADKNQEIARQSTIDELATQMIERIQILQKGNESQTTIVLRNPPVLEGATITLTASDHAKREFNISFANLSPDAKLLLDRKLTEDSLTETLERKGIIIHMLTTTTQADPLLTVDAGQTSRDQQEQQGRQDKQQQGEQRQKKPDNGEDEEIL